MAQDSVLNKKRLNWVRYGTIGAYSGSMVALHFAWYKQSQRTSFHFFNDADEWKQMDKAGHFFNAFHASKTMNSMLTWAGADADKRPWVSALVGFGLVSSIEVFDGFSNDYGASWSDLGANAAGSALLYGQLAAWKEIRIHPKMSFSRSGMAPLRPALLGENLAQEILKDYNGQTQWLSIDMDKFITFPKWLNIAVGYGAAGMKYARDEQNLAEGFTPYRQFYIGPDIDLTALNPRKKFWRTTIYVLNMIKLPAPSLEISKGRMKGHWLYF